MVYSRERGGRSKEVELIYRKGVLFYHREFSGCSELCSDSIEATSLSAFQDHLDFLSSSRSSLLLS